MFVNFLAWTNRVMEDYPKLSCPGLCQVHGGRHDVDSDRGRRPIAAVSQGGGCDGMGRYGARPRRQVEPKADAKRLPVPRPSQAASTTYRQVLASLVCGIVPLGLGLITIVSHKYSGFFLFGWVPAFAGILIGFGLAVNPDKRISRIGRIAIALGFLGSAAVMWATGWQDWGSGGGGMG
jgi:hypothetical protein